MFFIRTLQIELAHQMEGFLNSLNSSHIFIWLKAHRKYLKRGGNTWKVTDSMICLSHSSRQSGGYCATLAVHRYAPWWLMLAKASQL